MVEFGLKGGFVVRDLDGRTVKSSETDGYGYRRLRVFDCFDDANDFAISLTRNPTSEHRHGAI